VFLTHILCDKIPDTRINVILLVADKIFAWAASVTTIANSNIIQNPFSVKENSSLQILFYFQKL
ncbi:MAG: hypothetical protein IJR40_07285, partial [Treponema sp.]|nr:hypothetical protein [Treponema sp.]